MSGECHSESEGGQAALVRQGCEAAGPAIHYVPAGNERCIAAGDDMPNQLLYTYASVQQPCFERRRFVLFKYGIVVERPIQACI